MEDNGQFGYRLLSAVDVEKYSVRDARSQLLAQRDLGAVLDAAAAGAGLNRQEWKTESRGDGELAILPAGVDVVRAVGRLAREMELALVELNEGRSVSERLRLRLVMHFGTLTPGPFGYAGQAPIVTSRLLDAKPLRQGLARCPDRDLAVAVSDSLYHDVIEAGFSLLDPASFMPFRITVKRASYQGYLYQGAGGWSPRRLWDTGGPARPLTGLGRVRSAGSGAVVRSRLRVVR